MYAAIKKDKSVTSIHKSKKAAIKHGIKEDLVCINSAMPESMLTRVFNFATGKNVSRCRNKEKAIDEIYLNSKQPGPYKSEVQVKTEASVCKSSDIPAVKHIGIKAQIRAILTEENKPKCTVEGLMELTGGTLVSVRTAISDLKSDTYAGADGKLDILKNEKKEYYLASNKTAKN